MAILSSSSTIGPKSAGRIDPVGPSGVWPALRVHECFEMLADRQPAAPAIIADGVTVSYADLDGRANTLAHALFAQGVTTEEAVGVLTERSQSLPMAFLAILKAGGAYVPMGADLPPQRLANMATQSGMRRLIALDGLQPPAELLASLAGNARDATPAILRPEETNRETLAGDSHRPNQPGKTTDLVAILFTSGSTGQPQGVLLQHDACINMGYGHISSQNIVPNDRLLTAAAPGFILGFRELCLPLLAGAALVPASRALLDDPTGLLAAMSRHRVTVAMFTPSYLRLFGGAVPDGLRCLFTAGEHPNAEDARAYARKLDYWNVLGATEVCGSFCMLRVDPDGNGLLPSGRPFTNTAIYLLDGDGREVPPGEPGELYVVSVAAPRGYLNLPDLTAARFVETPFGRAYRSGDMGRWNDDGQLESLGRVNDVVKVSGQSVSLGEIEQTLLRHPRVRHAGVMQHEGKLIAFVESADDASPSPSLDDWRGFLAKTLPAYMLPAQVTTVAKIPLNSFGKVDRPALLALAAALPQSQSRNGADQGALPQGEVERHIAEVWEEILGVRPILREDNFYALGGTSLLSIAISQRLHALGYAATPQTILVSMTVAALAEKIALVGEQEPVVAAPDRQQDAATAGQEDFWIAWKLGLSGTGSHVTRVLVVRGAVPELERWQLAWRRLVARHAALRTAFLEGADDKVFWRALDLEELGPGVQLALQHFDSRQAAEEHVTAQLNAPFILTEAPLARAGLVQVEEGGETLFWFALHHSVVDGLSARILQEEMHALLAQGPLPSAPNGMVRASWAEQQYLSSELAGRDRDWWRHKLGALTTEAGGEAFNEFTGDHRRPAIPSGKSVTPLVEELDPVAVAALNRLARMQQVGLHALLLTLLETEARRRDGRKSLIIGNAISVRPPGCDRAIGYFVNLLPVILSGHNALTLAARIDVTQVALSEAVDRGSYPAGLMYREFRQQHPHARPHSRTSLFDVALTNNPSGVCGKAGSGFSLTPVRLSGELSSPAAGLDMVFSYEPNGEQGAGLELGVVWNPDVYSRATAQAWLSSFAAWTRWLAEDISRAGAPLPALLPDEARLLANWEPGPTVTRPAKRFHELFENLVDQFPQRLAVVAENSAQSYAELERHANRIAQALLDHGVAHQEPVAVLTECSPHLPATVLGIWKAGAVYLPLALEQPPERLAWMTGDAGAKILIVLDGHPVPPVLACAVYLILRPELLDSGVSMDRPQIGGTPQDLAYIIYTSGTTGMPKGVLLQHDNLINVAYASREAFGLTPDDRFSLVATPGFDASLWEMGAALLRGMALVPVSRALRDDPWALKRWYQQYGVTVAFHTPSYLRVSKQIPFQGLRVLVVGGEAPNHDDARCYADHVGFWNACGPTEACIFVCAEQIPPNPDAARPLPVGRPIANTCISIRRDNGDLTPPGVVGEVWIGGTGLARGYLNNPDLTARKFVETKHGRFYRSGDLGRWTEDGRLELAGRLDQQIKLHGQRVELGEIEQAIASHPAVDEAVAQVEASAYDTKVLRAFVRLRPFAAMPTDEDWRGYLIDRLPQHMLPASVTSVPAFPLTFAGKIDRDALLRVPRERGDGPAKSAPSGEMETRIAAVWSDLLGGGIWREDNFFALGGNSLLAVTMAHRLSRDLMRPVAARELFAAPTLAGFAQRIAELLGTALPAHSTQAMLAPGSAKGAPDTATVSCVFPGSDLATEGQREFRVAEAAGLDTRTFTIPLLRAVEGGMLSLDQWNDAWAGLVARHESLRTWFQEDAEGRLCRAVVPTLPPALEHATLPDRSSARAFVRQRQGEPFVMGVPPLWRAGLVAVVESGEQLFWLALHHSVGDGRSIGIIVEELSALLRGEDLSPLGCDFAESAAREEAYLGAPDCARDARYWRDLLARQLDPAFDEAPLDFARSLTAKTGTHRFETRLDAATAQGLKALAREHEASLHAVMLTLLALEARRRMGHADVLIGNTVSVRETAAEERLVGYYVNMLPLACHLPRDVAFGPALRQTQQALAAGLQHARYPFARMYRDFWSTRPRQRHPARYPLFDLAITENPESVSAPVSLRLTRVSVQALGRAGAVEYEHTDAAPGPDMVLTHAGLDDGGLLLQWHVNAALYTRETASRWFDGLRGWAVWLAEDRRRAQETLPSLLPGEAALLEGWEQGAKVARPALRFHELFERVLDTPSGDLGAGQGDRPAIVTEAGITTYSALEREANAIAHSLLSRGVTPGSAVGVLTGRSANLPAAVLGIWKAGATYLPLAADLPEERLEFTARDAGITLLIALDALAIPPALSRDLPPPFRPEEMDAEFRRTRAHRPAPHGNPADAAYIIYTSGSTGRPKGTLIGHDAYVNSVLGTGETIGLTSQDRSLLFASPSFDVSLLDIGLPLAFGAALCPVSYEVLSSPNRFRAFLDELDVTVVDITPTYLRLFDGAALPSLRILVTGGEAPFPADVETYAGRCLYFNAYGPTENTISSTMGRLRPGQGNLSSGRPLPNTSVHICDPEGNSVPPGVLGELWLGGTGLACGYLGRPDLTAAAFIETARGRRYRSGDLGRWCATGEIEILGRIDDQVKLNGIRIELGEIEHALASHPDIAQAAALLEVNAERSQSLWAFVRPWPGKEAPLAESWHAYLATRLPACMIPSMMIAIPVIPLTTSGKVDKAALKMLLAARAPQVVECTPQPGLEAEIAGLWGELLSREPGTIRRDDNFFALGGHSLLAIAVAHRLEKALGHPVPARELFAEPTLHGFAQRVGQLNSGAGIQPAVCFSDAATEGQNEFWVAEQAGLDTRGFNIPLLLAASGEVPPDPEWRSAWAALVTRHAALRTSFYQDAKGVLRRSALAALSTDLEISSQPDVPAAIAYIRERQTDPFVMETPPLWRAGLVHVAAAVRPVFWLALHHSVGDGVSLEVLTEELRTLLKGGTLDPIAGHFDHSAGQEESYLTGSACREDALYWRKTLSAPRPFDEWRLDFPRPQGRMAPNSRGHHSVRIRLDASIAARLREFAQKNGASLHALMLTMLAQEVRRRTGRSEFLLGTAASTRDSVSEARIVGYYVNMLPVPCRVQRPESFEKALRTMQQSLAEGLQHARYPFARMYRDFRQEYTPAPHPARYPLFDLAVTENPSARETKSQDPGELHFSSIAPLLGEGARYEFRLSGPAQDMVLVHEGQPGGGLVLQWYVNAGIYERETAEAWIDSLAGWARFLAAGKRLPNSPLPSLLPEEERLLAGWERGPALPHPAPSLPARFEHWAHVQPERPALVTEQGAQSYAVLNTRSNALAHALLALGVARQDVVGVLTDRSLALPETVLSIWKAGGCYLPMVTDLPPERLVFMARDAGIRVLVVLDGHQVPAPLAETGCTVFRPENLSKAFLRSHGQPPEIVGDGVGGSDLACILYTSGSTGVPKGVMLHHQGLNNLGVAMDATLDIRCDDRALLMASPSFDAWIADLAMAWTAGAAVVPILRGELADIAGMRDKMIRLGVSTATMTPSYLRLFEQADFFGLRLLITVGEPPHRVDALHYAARLRYVNGYGPTENTAAVSFGQIAAQAQRLTAGKPLANTSVHIRDGQGEPVPPEAVGCIWLGGMGLASGYLNRPDLTAASFVETPAGRLYSTGDLGRWTHTGELQILGRSDGQVKLRGQRVELGEIEYRLGAYPGVRQGAAAVKTQADGSQILWAFVCLQVEAAEPTQAAWHDYLSGTLPSYMLPAAVLCVPAIPVNTSGKVDREALLQMTSGQVVEADGTLRGTPPHDGRERNIAQVWAERLKCRAIAREDNFFDLGGDSLRAIAVVNQLRRTFHCAINDLYEHPRLADFARVCQPRPEHLRTLIQSAARHWQGYREGLAVYEAKRDAALDPARRAYETRNQSYRLDGAGKRRDYARVLLTGATGYLGSYLLRELLADRDRHVGVLVRGGDDQMARARLGDTLCHYFGPEKGTALRDNPRLTVLAGDLRREDLGLSSQAYDHAADSLQAVFHCAANVKHFGHYWEFHADNAASTARLLKLAAHHAGDPADFHLVSTLSVCGKAPETGFRLFTEYDAVPEVRKTLEENYYVRSKQEAERLVVAARRDLANACIHRVGNLVFAADGGPLQSNLGENAFFRQIAAFLRLGVAPDDSHLWLCHVDLVARGLVLLAGAGDLTNEAHHIENARRDTLAEFVTAAEGVRACGFDSFLGRLERAVDEPEMDTALTETLENFWLYRGLAPQERARRLEIVSGRTQTLLTRLGFAWPSVPPLTGQAEMLRQARRLFCEPSLSNAAAGASC
jgi:amino acid adenylation domain-containing protein/thioester reductase-like protein